MAHATATVDMMHPPAPAERGLDVYNNKLGMWVFLASEVMFFTALIGSYIILRFGAPGPWAPPAKVLNVPVTAFNTFLLICSSVTMVKAYAALAGGETRFLGSGPCAGALNLWMRATIAGGPLFVGVRAYEYPHLVPHGFLPSGARGGGGVAELGARGVVPAATIG